MRVETKRYTCKSDAIGASQDESASNIPDRVATSIYRVRGTSFGHFVIFPVIFPGACKFVNSSETVYICLFQENLQIYMHREGLATIKIGRGTRKGAVKKNSLIVRVFHPAQEQYRTGFNIADHIDKGAI